MSNPTQPEASPAAAAPSVAVALIPCSDGYARVLSSTMPPPMDGPELLPEHFDSHGRWVGPDWPAPYRRVTPGAAAQGRGLVESAFARYRAGDYGEGEVGFAVYETADGEHLYLVDDAVRSPEGEPPAREPATSPGPQTLLLSSEY